MILFISNVDLIDGWIDHVMTVKIYPLPVQMTGTYGLHLSRSEQEVLETFYPNYQCTPVIRMEYITMMAQ